MDQNIITLAIVFSTAIYVLFSLYRSVVRKKAGKCDGCSGCSLSQMKKDIVVNKVNAQQLSYKRL